MAGPHTLETLSPGQWELYRDLRLASLLDSPDAFGSTHVLEAARPSDLWRSRLAAAAESGADLPLLARISGFPAGLCWAKADPASPGVVNVFQMWVVPEHRRKGVASALLMRCIAWSRTIGATEVQLGVALADSPALRLYRRHGFEPKGAPEPLREGVALLAQNMSLALVAHS